jgi:uncharacterized protein (TIGR03437 family)
MLASALFGNALGVLASQVSMPDQSASPGSSLLLPIMFLSQGDSISGIQFDVQYDNSAMDLSAIVGDAARNSEKCLYYANLSPNLRRFLMVGLNQNVIPDGTLITLFINVNPNATIGVYPIMFSNVVATDPSGIPAPVSGANGTLTIQGDQSVVLQPSGVLNAGSLLAGPVAPGEVVTLIGSRMASVPFRPRTSTVLAGTSVKFDGIPALILYASPKLINVVVPYEVSGKASTQLQVKNRGQVMASLPLSVVPAVPAIFTLDASGVGPGAVLNEDSTINSPSNPAARGSLAVLLATGVGRENQVVGILPKPVLPISVQIGGLNVEVLGAGPELTVGVVQVKFRIPASVPPGNSVPLVLTVGTVRSQFGVTVAIQ